MVDGVDTGMAGMASSKVLGYFDGCLAINLDGRLDRLVLLEKECQRVGIEFERVPGVACPPEDWPDIPEYGMPEERWGHLGCSLSHKKVVTMARDRGWSNVLILEDDVVFAQDFVGAVAPALEELAELSWDLFYLWHRSQDQSPISERLDMISGTDQTHAYAINGPMFDRFLCEFDPVSEARAIDQWYHQWGGVVKLATRRNLAFQRPGWSNIRKTLASASSPQQG